MTNAFADLRPALASAATASLAACVDRVRDSLRGSDIPFSEGDAVEVPSAVAPGPRRIGGPREFKPGAVVGVNDDGTIEVDFGSLGRASLDRVHVRPSSLARDDLKLAIRTADETGGDAAAIAAAQQKVADQTKVK